LEKKPNPKVSLALKRSGIDPTAVLGRQVTRFREKRKEAHVGPYSFGTLLTGAVLYL